MDDGAASVIAVIAVGGMVGASARYGVTMGLPASPGGVPWATLVVNVSGCLAIGVLMVLIVEVWQAHRLLRPFVGTGVLGGYTTFSTYELDTHGLLAADRPWLAMAYLGGTAVLALAAVQLGVSITRALALRRPGPDDAEAWR